MNPLLSYRDDGLLAREAARRLPVRAGGLPVLVLGALPLIGVLAAAGGEVPAPAPLLAALAFLVLAGGAGARDVTRGRFAWAVPPLLRALEYGLLLWMTVLGDRHALPACYALLAVLAFHHYDTVYRLRFQRSAPPAWIGAAGGGWEGRLLIVCVLALAGALGVGLPLLAALLAVLFLSESAASWARFARGTARGRRGEDGGDAPEAA